MVDFHWNNEANRLTSEICFIRPYSTASYLPCIFTTSSLILTAQYLILKLAQGLERSPFVRTVCLLKFAGEGGWVRFAKSTAQLQDEK